MYGVPLLGWMGRKPQLETKPQQQTLSIRISDALRDFLERSKLVISNARGELVSTSDVAKILLESAKDDRLDHRLEVAELQQSPTHSMWSIRRKWEHKQDLSRPEWVFLAQYIQIACEEISENSQVPRPQAYTALLEALLAVRGLRSDRGFGLDRYYLGNLGVADEAVFNERQFDPDVVPQTVRKLIQQLREEPDPKKPSFAGRNFYVALRDEELPDITNVNRVLFPYMDTLFRLGARGHWHREQRPVRSLRDHEPVLHHTEPVATEGFRLTFDVTNQGELSLSLSMMQKDVSYPISRYPEICEFAAMLERFRPETVWDGIHFKAFATSGREGPVKYCFYRFRDSVLFGFLPEEWERLGELFLRTLSEPWMKPILSDLSLAYGEL
jgi:hypothetical protein